MIETRQSDERAFSSDALQSPIAVLLVRADQSLRPLHSAGEAADCGNPSIAVGDKMPPALPAFLAKVGRTFLSAAGRGGTSGRHECLPHRTRCRPFSRCGAKCGSAVYAATLLSSSGREPSPESNDCGDIAVRTESNGFADKSRPAAAADEKLCRMFRS
jgi:hypothetical protein